MSILNFSPRPFTELNRYETIEKKMLENASTQDLTWNLL